MLRAWASSWVPLRLRQREAEANQTRMWESCRQSAAILPPARVRSQV